MKLAKRSNHHCIFSPVVAAAVALFTTLAPINAIAATAKAEPKVVAYLSAGVTCEGAATTNIKAAGPTVKISLCVATTETLCGHTTKLQAASARESGRFHVIGVTAASSFPDPNSDLVFPIAITNPPGSTDLGATVARAIPGKPAKQLLATFDISPQANATEAAYTISIAPNSSVGVGADATCALPNDLPITANFRFTNPSVKESKL